MLKTVLLWNFWKHYYFSLILNNNGETDPLDGVKVEVNTELCRFVVRLVTPLPLPLLFIGQIKKIFTMGLVYEEGNTDLGSFYYSET
jgi:hypothetical protein